jgi:hypothetical protein
MFAARDGCCAWALEKSAAVASSQRIGAAVVGVEQVGSLGSP